MELPTYTLVCGVDSKHLEQLLHTLPNWLENKLPEDIPILIFYDRDEVDVFDLAQIEDIVSRYSLQKTTFVPWPPAKVKYPGNEQCKWYHPQRWKMFSGFVHVPAMYCETEYWLKLDTDTVALPGKDWVNPTWFEHADADRMAIVSQGWHYTKPPEQMLELDAWVEKHKKNEALKLLAAFDPLKLAPEEGADKVKHKRIISWCAFFNTEFTRWCSHMAHATNKWRIPVYSQDGYMWYCAARAKEIIKRVDMKASGWEHHGKLSSIKERINALATETQCG